MVVFSITVVRHGETLYNREKIMQGQKDIPLSDIGLQQAKLVGERLKQESYTHVFSSDLSRASQTAETIVDVNKINKLSITKDKRLRERKFGVLEGKYSKDYIEAARAASIKPVQHYTPPGGETLSQLRERASSFFTDLCKQLFNFINEKDEDYDYIPCSIKRRHGGSLGRNTSHKNKQMITHCQRSQSFCGTPVAAASENISYDYNVDVGKPNFEGERKDSLNSDSSLGSSITSISESEEISKDDMQANNTTLYEQSDSNSSGYTSQSENLTSEQEMSTVKNENSDGPSFFAKNKALISSVPYGHCPNVSVSPLISHRLPSISSISSGRNSSFDEVDIGHPSLADVLIVSHGGFIKELFQHFVDDLDCKVPGGKHVITRICPNCSISKFTVFMQDSCDKPGLSCNSLFDKDHLNEMECVKSDVAL